MSAQYRDIFPIEKGISIVLGYFSYPAHWGVSHYRFSFGLTLSYILFVLSEIILCFVSIKFNIQCSECLLIIFFLLPFTSILSLSVICKQKQIYAYCEKI